MLAEGVAADPELGLPVHLDLGDHPARRGIRPGEGDPGDLADDASPSVAPHEVPGAERRPVGQLDLDTVVALHEPDGLAAAKDRDPELVDPLGQDALDVALPEREHVVVTRREVAGVQRDQCVAHARMALAGGHESLGNAALIEHLDGARVQTAGARAVELLVEARLDDDDVGSRERQLRREHQSRRPASRDHHCVLGCNPVHPPPSVAGALLGCRLCSTTPGLRQAPLRGLHSWWRGGSPREIVSRRERYRR